MKTLHYIILFLSFTLSLNAQNFSVEISSDSILIGNYVELVYKIENIEGEFEAPNLEVFDIISGPNVSSTMQIINSTMTSTKQYSYYIKPVELGTFIIEPGIIITHDKKWESKQIKIRVVPNPENITIIPKERKSIFFNSPPFPLNEEDLNKKKESQKKLKRL